MHVSCTLRNCPAHLTDPFSESSDRAPTRRPLADPCKVFFTEAHDQPQNTAGAMSLHVAMKSPALRLVWKHRLLKVLQNSYITVGTTDTQIVTEIHRMRFVRAQTVVPLGTTSQIQLMSRLRLQSDKTLNLKRGVRRKPTHLPHQTQVQAFPIGCFASSIV